MTVFVFPGQGAQRKNMGQELFSFFPDLVSEADEILGYSVERLCAQGFSLGPFNQTTYVQTALYIINALSYFKKVEECAENPQYFAGHSLGEYSALLAAGAFDFPTGLHLVKKRSELMAQAKNGAMAAILGLDSDKITDILEHSAITDVVIANYNCPLQTVISGDETSVKNTRLLFEGAGATFIQLNVNGAFHSPAMRLAEKNFSEFLLQYEFRAPTIPVIANVDAMPYNINNIRSKLAKQISYPVRWSSTIEYLLAQGESTFVEVGPGRTLSGLINQIM